MRRIIVVVALMVFGLSVAWSWASTQRQAVPDAKSIASGAQLVVDVFGEEYVLVPEYTSNGLWSGSVKGYTDSSVDIAVVGKASAGTIRIEDDLYKWHYVGGGKHELYQVPNNLPLPEGEPIPVDTLPDMGVESPSGDDGSVIDILVAYTPASEARYGGQDGIEALINLAVLETNTAYNNSNISTQLNLAHVMKVDYVESGNMSTDLSRLRNTSDNIMDEVHAARDLYNADIVAMVEESGDYCGIAYLMTTLGNSFKVSAFSITYSTCTTGYYSFGHEIGHNMGMHHNRQAANGPGVFPYSFGYYNPAETFRTTLSYSCPTGCIRVQHYSNPDVYYLGEPTGIDYEEDPIHSADNARSLDEAKYTIANWRDGSLSSIPSDPSNIEIYVLEENHIALIWADNSDNEDGFVLERADGNGDWNILETLSANTRLYHDYTVVPETTYHYRVKAFNQYGESGYSNIVSGTTPAAPPTPTPVPTPTPIIFIIDQPVGAQIRVSGLVGGTIENTYAKDGVYQSITEIETNTKPPKYRYSYLEHKWVFDTAGGTNLQLNINAFATPSEDDEIVFSYSVDDVIYIDLFVVEQTAGNDFYNTFSLPDAETIYLRAIDTDRTIGNRELDTLYVDHLFVRLQTAGSDSIHLGDLVGSSELEPKNRWKAIATITVHDSGNSGVPNVVVSGLWEEKTAVSCTTNELGICQVSLSGIKGNRPSIVFSVNTLAHPDYVYLPTQNDVGSKIIVNK